MTDFDLIFALLSFALILKRDPVSLAQALAFPFQESSVEEPQPVAKPLSVDDIIAIVIQVDVTDNMYKIIVVVDIVTTGQRAVRISCSESIFSTTTGRLLGADKQEGSTLHSLLRCLTWYLLVVARFDCGGKQPVSR